MDENRQIVIGGFIDEYFNCPYRLLKCFREGLKPGDFIDSPFVKDVLMKNGLEYEKKVFSKLKFEMTTKGIMQLIKEKAAIKHPWLVIRSDRIQDSYLRSELEGMNLIGVPDIISPYKNKGYVPIEIKSHKTITKQDKLRLAYYSFILNNLLNTNLNSAYIILKKDAEKGVMDNLEKINLENEDYKTVTDVLLDLKLMKEGKKEFEPIRSKECSSCSEKGACKDHMIKTGNLTLLQGVGGTARQKLIEQNINTIHDLIEFDDSRLEDFDSLKKIILKARSLVNDIIYQTTDFPKINENLVFLDIETELMDGKKIWLIGAWHNNKFIKFYANTYNNEKEMLKKFISFLSGLDKPRLIIYSGSNFDYNTILNRLKSLELDYKLFEKIKFTDICLKLKNSYIFPIQSYKLKPLAEYLGYNFRYTDLDGTLATIAYEKHIRSGEKLDEVYFVYNEDDVLSMKFIYEWALNSNDNRIERLFDKSLIGLTDEKIRLVRDYYEDNGYFKKKIDKRYPNTIDYELRLKFSDFDLMKEIIAVLRHNGFSVGNPYNDRGRKVLR